jgi:hypothetical protein
VLHAILPGGQMRCSTAIRKLALGLSARLVQPPVPRPRNPNGQRRQLTLCYNQEEKIYILVSKTFTSEAFCSMVPAMATATNVNQRHPTMAGCSRGSAAAQATGLGCTP